MLLGVDCSSFDFPVNFELAHERGVGWASLRATTGSLIGDELYVDPSHEPNTREALANNVLRMPYHWYVPRKTKGILPETQARHFLKYRIEGELPSMLDLEDTKYVKAYPHIGEELRVWIEIVEHAEGRKPVIYTSPSYIKAYLQRETWLSQYPLFIANYNVSYPYYLRPWTPDWYAWQYCQNADGLYYGLATKGCALALLRQT